MAIKNIGVKGQSSVEFIFSFIFAFGFFIFFIRLAINYTNGYLVHYATFMSSRAYMVYDKNENESIKGDGPAFDKAKKVFNLFKLGAYIPGFKNELKVQHPDSGATLYDRNLLVGVYTEYKVSLPYPLLSAGNEPLELRSDSFLGREPSRSECIERTCDVLINLGSDSRCSIFTTLVDNGC